MNITIIVLISFAIILLSVVAYHAFREYAKTGQWWVLGCIVYCWCSCVWKLTANYIIPNLG